MPDKLTVVQLLPALESGGVERGTLEIGRALVLAGHRSVVISGGGRMVAQLQAEGSEHIDRPVGRKSPFSLRLIPGLRRLFSEERVDLLHARSRIPAWLAYMAWSGMSVQRRPHWVTTVHGFYSVGRYSAIMTSGEKVIAVSEVIRDYISANYPQCRSSDVTVIPRGVDEGLYRYGHKPPGEWLADWYAEFPETRYRAIVSIVGRLSSGKGIDVFIEVLAGLQEGGLDVAGVIVGGVGRRSRSLRAELEQKARRMGVKHLVFCGEREDGREIMAISTLLTSFSSRPESFGRTVLESLSLGVPVVGFDHGGVGEILGRVYPEGRVRPGDVRAATEKAAELISSPITVPRTHPYTLKRMTSATIELYERTCGAATGPSSFI